MDQTTNEDLSNRMSAIEHQFVEFKASNEAHLKNQDLMASNTRELAQQTHELVTSIKNETKETSSDVKQINDTWAGNPATGNIGMYAMMISMNKSIEQFHATSKEAHSKRRDFVLNVWVAIIGAVVIGMVGLFGFMAMSTLHLKSP